MGSVLATSLALTERETGFSLSLRGIFLHLIIRHKMPAQGRSLDLKMLLFKKPDSSNPDQHSEMPLFNHRTLSLAAKWCRAKCIFCIFTDALTWKQSPSVPCLFLLLQYSVWGKLPGDHQHSSISSHLSFACNDWLNLSFRLCWRWQSCSSVSIVGIMEKKHH